MKKALDVYEQLKDASSYVLSDWLRLPVDPDSSEKIITLNAAASFLFDRLMGKENAGLEISNLAKEELMEGYDPHELSDLAAKLLSRMQTFDFEKDQTFFSEYYRFIIQTESYVKDSLLDNEGKLAIAYIEELIYIIIDHNKEQAHLKVGEYVFLNLTDCWRLIYKDLLGPRFGSLKSCLYFEGVGEESERIRKDINE